MGVVVAIDAGTTGVRSFAVDHEGRPVGRAYREFSQHFPKPGWVEHDPIEIWDAVTATLAELAASLEQPISAIGITDQRETVVLWDKTTGEPLHRAIVWQDRRTAARCDELTELGHLRLVRATTGLVLDPYFSATKLEWLLRDDEVATNADTAFGTIDSWVLWNLTDGAEHATDVSNASRTMLFDIAKLAWSDDLTGLFDIPASILPEVRPSSGRLGVTGEGLPIPAGIPISGMAGDQQAALFGQACFTPGMTKNTYGTGSFVLMNVGDTCPEPQDGLLTTVAWTLADGTPTYALEGAVFVTGAAIQWLRDGLGIIDEAADLEPLAKRCEDTGGVYFVPAFAGLGSPWWDPYARGAIVGMTRGTGRPEIARAVIESIAFQSRDVVEAMTAASGRSIVDLRVDGGASVMDSLLQFQADQLGVRVLRSKVQETTALGAAYLAGLAEGVWSSTEDLANNWSNDAIAEPSSDPAVFADGERRHAQWLRAVERSRSWEQS